MEEQKYYADHADPVYKRLAYICDRFKIEGELMVYRYIPSGHINTSYYVGVYDGKEIRQFLIQRINTYVFRDPVSMMNNIDLITQHIIKKQPTMERRRRLHFHHTWDGDNFLVIKENGEEQYWRLYNYIESSTSFETVDGNAEVLRLSGTAFGNFMNQLQDFDAGQLVESIPHFHDTRHRLKTFFEDVKRNDSGRAGEVLPEIELIRQSRKFGEQLCELLDAGELPIRVTHNDTKTNNILFDRESLDPLVIIDLDTCMPGLACYDFGDTIRFAAGTKAEDVYEGMELDIEMFRAYAEGYLSVTKEYLTEKELETLATGACVITLEQAVRFLGDYINGDKYFRIDYPKHNYDRAKAQLALYRSMREHLDEMNRIVHEIAGR